jgi:hypothetical protein
MARSKTRSGARTPRRRPATSEILAPAAPCPWPPEAFEHLGGNLEQIAGHLRGLVSALREFDVAHGHAAELSDEEKERRSWLFEALLDAVEHEQDRLQELAPMAAYGARAVGARGEEA